MIENKSFGLDIGLGFRHVWTGPTYPINNNILFFYFFESVSLYTVVILQQNVFIKISNHSTFQSKHDETQQNKIKQSKTYFYENITYKSIKNKRSTSYKISKLRENHEERLTLLIEHNLVDI